MYDSKKEGILSGLERLIAKIEELLRAGMNRAADNAACAIGERTDRIVTAYRNELHRTIAVFALSIAMAFFACTTAVFIAFTAFMGLWQSHQVMAPLAAAGIFALCAGLTWRALTRKTHAHTPQH